MKTSAENNKTKITFWDYLYPPKLGEKLGKINAELDMAERAKILREIEEEIEIQNTKTCPDCGETVNKIAKVCRYCGHRFKGKKKPT